MNGKNQTSFQKTWEVLFPWPLYYLAYNAAYIILLFLQSAMQNGLGEGYGQWVAAHAATVRGVTGGIGMLLGICPLLPLLNRELTNRVNKEGEKEKRDGSGGKRFSGRAVWKEMVIILILAVSSSLGLNVLLTLTGLAKNSQTYREVAEHQYGVAFGIGIILYGLVSPLTEEILFRGVVYNRLRRFYGPVVAVIVSGVLFGVFHGNLVQGVYGTCMGILLAYVYERKGRFFIPVLFHAAANTAVYSIAHVQTVQNALFTPVWCVVLLALSAVCIFFMEKRKSSSLPFVFPFPTRIPRLPKN